MDELIEKCGSFGKYQKMLLGIIGYVTAVNGLYQYMTVFNNAIPQLICNPKPSLSPHYIQDFSTESCDAFRNISLSKELGYDSPYECHYDTTYFGKTIVNEWDLICDRIHLAGLTQTLFMIGSMLSVVNGIFSDMFGRKKVCFVCALCLSISLLVCEVFQLEYFGFGPMTKYSIYATTQFVVGFCVYSLDIITYVLLIEFTTPRHMNFISIFNIIMYVVGMLVLLLICYLVRNWQIQNWCASFIAFVASLLIMFILPESPRFLVVKQRYHEATQVLFKIAQFNGSQKIKRLSNPVTEESILKQIREIANDEEEIVKLNESTLLMTRSNFSLSPVQNLNKDSSNNNNKEVTEENIAPSLRTYLTHPIRNLINSIALAYVWMSIALIYFGMTIGVTSINKDFNPYLMFFLSCIGEIAGYLIGLLGKKHSRKNMIALHLGLTALMSLPVALIPSGTGDVLSLNKIFIIFFATMGKVFCSTSLYLMYHFSSLVYPTSVRNTMVSIVSSFGRLGAVIAPQVTLLRFLVWGPLPYYIFSMNTLLACFAVYILPNDKKIRHEI